MNGIESEKMDTKTKLQTPVCSLSEMDAAVAEFTPATVQQLIELLINRMAVEMLPEITGLMAVSGRISDPGQARGAYHYGVKILDDGGAQIKARLPKSLVSTLNLAGGERVRAVGRLQTSVTNYGIQVELQAGDLQRLSDQGQAERRPDAGRMTLDALKRLPLIRRRFPEAPALTLAMVQSSSLQAQVNLDCRSEMNGIEGLQIEPVPVNMLDPVAISSAIRSIDADILMIIRGGGDAADFEVFDDPRVVDAVVNSPSYRIAGLGHSGNATLVDLVADHSARTPGQAGVFVRETIDQHRRRSTQAEERLAGETRARQLAEKELEVTRTELRTAQQTHSNQILWPAVAFVAGLIAAFILKGVFT